MDFYALQMTPRKKDKKDDEDKTKKTDFASSEEKKERKIEHVFTKEEVIADLSKNKGLRGFMYKIVPHGKGADLLRETTEESKDQIKQESKEGAKENLSQAKEEEPEQFAPTPEPAREQKKEILPAPVPQTPPFDLKEPQPIPSSEIVIEKIVKKSEEEQKEKPTKIKKEKKEKLGFMEIFSPNFKLVADAERKEKKKKEKRKAPSEKIEVSSLGEREQEVLENLVFATRDFDQEKIRNAIEKIAAYRNEDENNLSENASLNVAIKQKLLEGISSQLAYGGAKNIINLFELIDELGIETQAKDFSVLDDEILKSPELRSAVIKYLLWCTNEFANTPMEIEKRIATFFAIGIISAKEIKEMQEFQEKIEKNLLTFAKENQKNPLEVERKIYEYSLAGLIDGKDFKKNPKMKEQGMKFIFDFIEDHLERVELIEKKIAEHERAGIIVRADLKNDEKIKNLLEKYLKHYVKENIEHPRKATMRVNDFFKMGLISNQTKEDFLREVR